MQRLIVKVGLRKQNRQRSGVTLLVVLFVVMAVTIISLSFLSKSSVELACGDNMSLRVQTDYLAESGLEHVKGLILSPQGISGEYWPGASGQQLVAGSSDYYDVNVVKVGHLDYKVNSTGYRVRDGQKVGLSRLQGHLRLEPCVAFWQNNNIQPFPAELVINGDAFCLNDMVNYGLINGDAYSAGSITNYGSIVGRQNAGESVSPVNSPALLHSDYSTQYYYNGGGPYSVDSIADMSQAEVTLGPTVSNPAGVYYCSSNLNLEGTIKINGTLVVKNCFRIRGEATTITIIPVKSMPALIVGNAITTENNNTTLNVEGLVQIKQVDMKNMTGSVININGALYMLGEGLFNVTGCNLNVIGSADKAAIEIWDSTADSRRWTPAVGAFYKSIERQ